MALAKKMYLKDTTKVAAVNLPGDVELDDVTVNVTNASDADVVLWFVKDSGQLAQDFAALEQLHQQGTTFWLFYPKKPHLDTDLNRDLTWQTMLGRGLKGTRQVGIDDLWSCIYYKAQ